MQKYAYNINHEMVKSTVGNWYKVEDVDQALAELRKQPCKTCGGSKKVKYEPDDIQGDVMIPCPNCQQPPAGEFTKRIEHIKEGLLWLQRTASKKPEHLKSVIEAVGHKIDESLELFDIIDRQAAKLKDTETLYAAATKALNSQIEEIKQLKEALEYAKKQVENLALQLENTSEKGFALAEGINNKIDKLSKP